VVGFARLAPYALLALPAGLAADRWSRKHLMIGADGLRALALGGLALAIALDEAAFWLIAAAAFVDGACSVTFDVAQTGALRGIVPRPQLPAAVGAQRARAAVVQLAGPPLGGALFGLHRVLPFAADSVSYAFSLGSVAALRAPFQEEREREPSPIRSRLAEGFRFLWNEPFIRATTFIYALGNVTVPALLLVVVVVGRRQGLTSAEIGALLSTLGAALLLGALASPLFRRYLSVRTIVLAELVAALAPLFFLAWPSIWVLMATVLPQAVVIPVTDSVVVGYRVAVTPDRLLGRAESVRSNLARLFDPFGPLAAGFLLSTASARTTVGAFLALSAALLLYGALSPAVRAAPDLAELS
jgi:MFS family permease